MSHVPLWYVRLGFRRTITSRETIIIIVTIIVTKRPMYHVGFTIITIIIVIIVRRLSGSRSGFSELQHAGTTHIHPEFYTYFVPRLRL